MTAITLHLPDALAAHSPRCPKVNGTPTVGGFVSFVGDFAR